MSNPSQTPPIYPGNQIEWLVAWVLILQRRVNALSGGGGGSVTLPDTQIAFGSSTNEITSSNLLTYDISGGGFFKAAAVASGFVALGGTTSSIVGDYFAQGNSTQLIVDDNNKLITGVGGVGGGGTMLSLDGDNLLYRIGDVGGLQNNTHIRIDDNNSLVDIRDGNGVYFKIQPGVVTSGDPNSIGNDTLFVVDDPSQNILANIQGAQVMLLDGANGQYVFGPVATTNSTKLIIDDTGSSSILGNPSGVTKSYVSVSHGGSIVSLVSIDNTIIELNGGSNLIQSSTNGGTGKLLTDLAALTGNRARTEPDIDGTYGLATSIGSFAYGTTVDISNSIVVNGQTADISFNSSTGTATVLLPTGTNAASGYTIVISDTLAIATISNITIDAGTGNTINGSTIAQTFVMNINGQSITLKKLSSTVWKIQ